MRLLLDTNVLMRLTDETDERHTQASAAIATADDLGYELVVVPQTLWTAATRQQNGLGMSVEEAGAYIDKYRQMFAMLDDTPAVFDRWLWLVRKHGVTGTNAYDGRLAGAMQAHGIRNLLTFNARDFRKYGITAVDPETLDENRSGTTESAE